MLSEAPFDFVSAFSHFLSDNVGVHSLYLANVLHFDVTVRSLVSSDHNIFSHKVSEDRSPIKNAFFGRNDDGPYIRVCGEWRNGFLTCRSCYSSSCVASFTACCVCIHFGETSSFHISYFHQSLMTAFTYPYSDWYIYKVEFFRFCVTALQSLVLGFKKMSGKSSFDSG